MDSLPLLLRFALLPTYTFRRDCPLVPILYVRFPAQPVISTLPPAGSSSPSLNTRFIDVVRILDPEHREPFIALGRLLAIIQPVTISPLSALSILRDLSKSSGLLKPAYSLLLNGLAPFPDLWVTLPFAREIAKRYGLLQDDEGGLLAHLLSWETRAVWSVVTLSSARTPVRNGELVSNWRVPEEVLALRDCSLANLSEITFTSVELMLRTIGEDGLMRLSVTIPSPNPLKPSAFKTFPDTLLSDLCLLSVDVANDRPDSELEDRIGRSIEALGALVLGQYRSPQPESPPPSSSEQIEAIGLVLFSVWQGKLVPPEIVTSPPASSDSGETEVEDGLETGVATQHAEPPGVESNGDLLKPISPEVLERIEARLDELLGFHRRMAFPVPQATTSYIHSRWIWLGMVLIGYILGISQRDA